MVFRIADSFTDSLAKLTNEEQKAVKNTAFDLQIEPSGSGMQFHRLDRAKDKHFWSVRVSRDIRIIVHKTDKSLLLCYVNHHDKAYDWAGRRKIEIHPKTGAAQLVELRETIQKVFVPEYTEVEKAPAVSGKNHEDLLALGIPEEWIDEILKADEDQILEIAEYLPAEASEAVLNLAAGITPNVPVILPENEDPFSHPDAMRRFRVMENVEELSQALEYPWDKWSVFLHPVQKIIVEDEYSGPVRVSGSAGTGKTIVALHRAVFLAEKNPGSRILLATFSNTLADALFSKLRILIHSRPRLAEQIEVKCLDDYAAQLYRRNIGKLNIPKASDIEDILSEAVQRVNHMSFNQAFIMSEWKEIVDQRQIESCDEYCSITRIGRKRRLSENQRKELWQVFAKIKTLFAQKGLVTTSGMYRKLSELYEKRDNAPFDFVIVDEAQDLSISQLRFLSTIGRNDPGMLFFAGDPGQRIFQLPFSWKALGIDIAGRAKTLKINYRTSHQIRSRADLLLDTEITDVDGNTENRRDTVSVFNGINPDIKICDDEHQETKIISTWFKELLDSGVTAHEIGLLVRSENELPRATAAAEACGINYRVLTENFDIEPDVLSILTMPLAKGLEFRAVAVMACDDLIIPLESRIDEIADEADFEMVYNTERHLLYVACTRARDALLVTGVKPGSEFLDDMRM